MIEKIKAYSKCEFDIDNPKIRFSCRELGGVLTAGQSREENFVIQSSNEVPIAGHVEVFDQRIRLLEGTFDTTSYTVTFCVSAKGMQEGEEISGAFQILTNGGEYALPYRYTVTKPALETRQGLVSNLDEFTQLAQMHSEEALRVFTHPQFVSVLCREEQPEVCQRIYSSLRKSALNAQAMEEFLVTMGKKECVKLTPVSSRIDVAYDCEDVSRELQIRRNTWGYVNLHIQCASASIFLPKQELEQEDFIGDEARVPLVIALDALPTKKCSVAVRFFNTYQEFLVTLYIHPKKSDSHSTAQEVMFSPSHLKKTYQKQLLSDYLAYRAGTLKLQEYADRSIECANELMKFEEENHWYRLIRLHIYIMKKDRVRISQEMETIEQHRDRMLKDPLSRCYYGYLTALYGRDPDTIARVLEQLREEYEHHPDQFLIFFMILYLDESYVEDRERIYAQLERIYEAGSNSPMLYYEACELFNEYPNMLRELSGFALHVAQWGFLKGYLDEEVRARCIALAQNCHRYSDKLFRLLDGMYRQQPNDTLLHAICVILMKGRRMDARSHDYYALGVERSFKLIGLMEYYIQSMDYTGYPVLPQQVVLYFGYEEKRLSERQLAYLYANVTVNREAYGNAFSEYRDAICAFVVSQVQKGAMSQDLEILYQAFLGEAEVSANVAQDLPKVLFKQRVTCENPNITAVLVDYDECTDTHQAPMVDQVAYVDALTDHTNLTLVDREHKRYIGSVSYQMQPILHDESFLTLCYDANPKSFPVLLRLAHYARRAELVDYEVVKVYRALLEFDALTPEYRRYLNGAVLDYYYQQYEGDIFEEYLRECPLALLEEENRSRAICHMIDRELWELAFEAVRTYGSDGIPIEALGRLCSGMAEQEGTVADDLLIRLSYTLFLQDCYQESVLRYLIRYARGTNAQLLAVYRAAVRLQFDTLDLEERIVTQALLSDVYDDAVVDVFARGANKKINTFVYEAFLNMMAHRYFTQNQPAPAVMGKCWLRACRDGHLQYPLAQAALLKFCANHRELAQTCAPELEEIVGEFVRHDMLLPCMGSLEGVVELPKEMYIKSFLVYRSRTGRHVDVHYYRKGPKRPQPRTERMREYFDGIYVKDFVLFDDEELQYYVTDEADGVVQRIEPEALELSSYVPGSQESRFAMINQLLKCRQDGDTEAFQEMLGLYIKDLYRIDSNMTLL